MIETLKLFSFTSFLKLITLVLVLYFFTVGFYGIVSPEGTYYSAFLDHNLNFIDWFRSSIMFVANLIAHAFGTKSYIANKEIIKIGNDIEFQIWFACLGFGVTSFWISLVVNSSSTLQRKCKWCLLGILSIWFINCVRIAFFIISVDKNWPENNVIDHHDLFNIFAYTAIIILMYFYSKNDRQHPVRSSIGLPDSLQNASQ